MKLSFLFAAACLMTVVAHASALTWSGENIADANTIALYHFNEGTGTTTASSAGVRPNFNLSSAGLWSNETGWAAAGAGMSLSNVDAAGTGQAQSRMGVLASAQSINWDLPGVTVSFWMRDAVNRDQNNQVVDMGLDGWKNLQTSFGYRTQWANLYTRHDGVGGPERRVTATGPNGGAHTFLGMLVDGNWHHVAMVFDNTTDTASLYIDNVQRQLGVDANGNPVMSWSTAGGKTGVVSEIMTIGNYAGYIDELLIQGEAMNDFSNFLGSPTPEPSSVGLLTLAGAALLRRRRA